MQNTINNRFDIPCYSFIAINPGKVAAFFRRMAIFFKATLAIKGTRGDGSLCRYRAAGLKRPCRAYREPSPVSCRKQGVVKHSEVRYNGNGR